MKTDVLGRGAVHGGFGLGQLPENGQREFARPFRQDRGPENLVDVAKVPMRVCFFPDHDVDTCAGKSAHGIGTDNQFECLKGQTRQLGAQSIGIDAKVDQRGENHVP